MAIRIPCSDKPKEKETMQDYLILRIFKTNDWEGAYHETAANRISCAPRDLETEMRKLPLVKGPLYDKRYVGGKYFDYVCAEIIAIGSGLRIAKRLRPDYKKYRPKRRNPHWYTMRVRK
jgi:hypothetical protein